MGQLPKLVSYSSKLVLQILPSISATVIGGYLLAQIHVGRNSEPPAPQIVVAAPPAAHEPRDAAHDVPTVREDRAAMRKVLKERRENPQAPALVRPAAVAQPAPATKEAASTPAAMDSIPPHETVERAAAPSRTKPAVATAAPPRREADAPARTHVESAEASADYVPAPPPGLPAAPATAMNAPTPIVPPPPAATVPMAPARAVPPPPPLMPPAMPPAMASAAPPPVAPLPPPPTGPVGSVFSALSSIVGHAANATGSTVNWVIDLPGKAISAGGRVIGVSSPPPEPAHFSDGQG
jgi:hypothetical protein